MGLNSKLKVGTLVHIKDLEGKIIGLINYANPQDNGKCWTEYRIKTNKGERWLSVDEVYNEYSISWAANGLCGQIGPEWHEVDSGVQVVKSASGDVDVDNGERANFVEYEDASEEKTLSVEVWSDGTEFSYGYYIKAEDVLVMGYKKPPIFKSSNSSNWVSLLVICIIIGFWAIPFLISLISSFLGSNKKIEPYLKKSDKYDQVTSISGNEKQKAMVYEYSSSSTTDTVAKDIIDGVEGNTESITQKDNLSDETIGILTKNEYCLVYHPEENESKVYVQVSSRKYNYTSNNAPYHSSSATTDWYRGHYYGSSYSTDSSKYHSMPSAYQSYNGTIIHNQGNGYFDSYSSSIRQSSVSSRKSSGGGLSSGK